jgi:hypothetical protein
VGVREEAIDRDALRPASEPPFWERPETGPDDPPLERVPGEPYGFEPLVETAPVPAITRDGQRTTLDGHFRKRVAATPAKEIR